jgi:hypothetical protein
MKKIYKITEEEFAAIKDAIEAVLSRDYEFVTANNGEGRGTSMSKETFFEHLWEEFIIEGEKEHRPKEKVVLTGL